MHDKEERKYQQNSEDRSASKTREQITPVDLPPQYLRLPNIGSGGIRRGQTRRCARFSLKHPILRNLRLATGLKRKRVNMSSMTVAD